MSSVVSTHPCLTDRCTWPLKYEPWFYTGCVPGVLAQIYYLRRNPPFLVGRKLGDVTHFAERCKNTLSCTNPCSPTCGRDMLACPWARTGTRVPPHSPSRVAVCRELPMERPRLEHRDGVNMSFAHFIYFLQHYKSLCLSAPSQEYLYGHDCSQVRHQCGQACEWMLTHTSVGTGGTFGTDQIPLNCLNPEESLPKLTKLCCIFTSPLNKSLTNFQS